MMMHEKFNICINDKIYLPIVSILINFIAFCFMSTEENSQYYRTCNHGIINVYQCFYFGLNMGLLKSSWSNQESNHFFYSFF